MEAVYVYHSWSEALADKARILLCAPPNAGPIEVIDTIRSPILEHCFWKTFVHLSRNGQRGYTKRTYFLNFIVIAFQYESFIFWKTRTFPFSDFHGDRTPLKPEKMDISTKAIKQWNPPSWKESNQKKGN